MLAVLFLALAVPLTLLVLGGRNLFLHKQPAPEVPELRASLESAATKALPPPAGLGGGRRFTLESRNSEARRDLIEKTAAGLGGVVFSSPMQEGRGVRMIVQIPEAAVGRFEASALSGIMTPDEPAPGMAGFYEILLPQP